MELSGEVPDWIEQGKEELEAWIKEELEKRAYRLGRLSYTFGGDAWIRAQNVKHLNHDYATDIISFDWSKGKKTEGEFLIGVDQIRAFASENALDEREEFQRVMIHGVLHLIGYDDITDNEKVVMRNEENKCLILRPF